LPVPSNSHPINYGNNDMRYRSPNAKHNLRSKRTHSPVDRVRGTDDLRLEEIPSNTMPILDNLRSKYELGLETLKSKYELTFSPNAHIN